MPSASLTRGMSSERWLPGVTTSPARLPTVPAWKQPSKSSVCASGSARRWRSTGCRSPSARAGHRLRRAQRRRQVHHDAGDPRPGRGRRRHRAGRRPALPQPAAARCSHVGSLLDAAALQPSRTARNHLLWLAHSQGLTGRRVDEVLEQAGLQARPGGRRAAISLGMRQRLGIAAALLGDPPVADARRAVQRLDPEGIVWMRGSCGRWPPRAAPCWCPAT